MARKGRRGLAMGQAAQPWFVPEENCTVILTLALHSWTCSCSWHHPPLSLLLFFAIVHAHEPSYPCPRGPYLWRPPATYIYTRCKQQRKDDVKTRSGYARHVLQNRKFGTILLGKLLSSLSAYPSCSLLISLFNRSLSAQIRRYN